MPAQPAARITSHWSLPAVALLTLAMPAHLPAAPAPQDPLVRIHYDFELTSYCSLINTAVAAGFKRQLAFMIQRHDISQDAVLQARAKASMAVYREWQNRSLGGFKGWCRNEGAASVQRFSKQSN